MAPTAGARSRSRSDVLRAQLGCEEDELVGECPAHLAMLEKLVMVAPRKVRVLLTGPRESARLQLRWPYTGHLVVRASLSM
jgi:DNA-binding NtrC family response regulator